MEAKETKINKKLAELKEEELKQITGGIQNNPNSDQIQDEIPGAEGKYTYPTYSAPEKQIKIDEAPKDLFP